jgi:hypothetical protein
VESPWKDIYPSNSIPIQAHRHRTTRLSDGGSAWLREGSKLRRGSFFFRCLSKISEPPTFRVPQYYKITRLATKSPLRSDVNLICRQMHSFHQICHQSKLCVNLKADFAIVCDGERNVAGHGARVTPYHLGSCTRPRYESARGWIVVVVTAMAMCSPEWSLIQKRDCRGTNPGNRGVVY